MDPLELEKITRECLLIPSSVKVCCSIEKGIGYDFLTICLYPEFAVSLLLRDLNQLADKLFPSGCAVAIGPLEGFASPGLTLAFTHININGN